MFGIEVVPKKCDICGRELQRDYRQFVTFGIMDPWCNQQNTMYLCNICHDDVVSAINDMRMMKGEE